MVSAWKGADISRTTGIILSRMNLQIVMSVDKLPQYLFQRFHNSAPRAQMNTDCYIVYTFYVPLFPCVYINIINV